MKEYACENHGKLKQEQIMIFFVDGKEGEVACGLCFQKWIAETFPLKAYNS